MRIPRKLLITSAIVASFLGFVLIIGWLSSRQIVTIQMAGLLVVALFGLYVGFGILIAVYRVINKLD